MKWNTLVGLCLLGLLSSFSSRVGVNSDGITDPHSVDPMKDGLMKDLERLISSGKTSELAATVVGTPGKKEVCTDTSQRINCDPSHPFRTLNGICNNLDNPFWGVPFTPLRRLVPAAYEDGKGVPRGGFDSKLPNPRFISTTVHQDLIKPDSLMTNMVAQMLQFFGHDLSFSPEANYKCCGEERHEQECWPIRIPESDYFYGKLNQTCMSFTRSTPYCITGSDEIREQMNAHTSFIDGSHIYGHDELHAWQLREHRFGRLLTNDVYKDFLPTKPQLRKMYGEKAMLDDIGFLVSGDHRTNVIPGLTALHILFLREHNRIATQIFAKHPDMSDELLYQSARRILLAEWQRIIFAELLPIVLSEDGVKQHGLNITEGSSYTDYNANVDPRIFHGFSGAAYRFGQTLVNGFMFMMRGFDQVGMFRTRNSYFNSDIISVNSGEGYDLLLSGLLIQHPQSSDPFLTEDITNYMWRPPGRPFGDDLAARNIQRARDHGIPPYDTYRQYCGLQGLTTWNQRPSEIPMEHWSKLKDAYKRPQDIDLFPGGLSETPVPGALTGPVFSCLLGKQLHALRYGDRFFYTHGDQAGSFNPVQLSALNKVTLGDLLCLNSDLKGTQRNVFRPVSAENPWVRCNDRKVRKYLNIGLFA